MKKSKWDAPGIASYVEAQWGTPNEMALREEVADWVGYQRGRLLDIGCGSARIAPLLKGCHYVGLDGSEELIKLARERAEDVEVGDIERLPFPDRSIPSALCMQVLRHLPSYERTLAELARVVARRLFIVDILRAGATDSRGESTLLGVNFLNSVWALDGLLAALARHFPGWKVEKRIFHNLIVGLKVEAP